MNTPSVTPKTKKVADVLVQITQGMSISAACCEVGLSRSTYYDYLKKHPEIITEHQEAIKAEMRKILGILTLEMRRLLEVTITQAFAEDTPLRERITLLKFLFGFHQQLMEMDLVKEERDDLAAQILRTLPPREYGRNVLDAVSPDDKYNDEDDTATDEGEEEDD